MTSAGGFTYEYDANGNMTSRNGSSIGYTSYNLPNVINAPGGYSSTLSYGVDGSDLPGDLRTARCLEKTGP